MISSSPILNHNHTFNFFVFLFFLLTFLSVSAQPWQQNDLIFNPSGIPSLSFSQPRFSDLDADHDYDLILGNVDGYPLFFRNTGTPSSPAFQAGPAIFSSVSFLDAEVGVLVDLDGDSDLDFVCGGFTGLNFYRNIGDSLHPEFQKVDLFFQELLTGAYPVPTLADLDADADLDLLIGMSENGALKFYENLGTADSAVFLESTSQMWADVGLYAYPYFADLDNDHDVDLLVGRDVTGFIFYRNIGDSSQWQWQPDNTVFSALAQTTYWNSPCLIDLNNDQKKDLIYGTAAGPLNYYVNTGTAQSPIWTVQSSPFGGVLDVGGASSPALFDFDDDGDLDLLSGTQLGPIKYYENIGTPFGPAWQEKSAYFNSISHSIYSAVAVGDVNGDSLPDIIAGDLSGRLFFHLNNGNGFIYQSTVFAGVDIGDWSAPILIDMDDDSDLDLIAGNEAGNLFYFENTGTPNSASWQAVPGYFGTIDVGANCVPAAGDLDQDGDIDIVTGDLFGEVQFFRNDSGAWVEDPTIVLGVGGGQNTAPALGDLDGDGDLDLTLGNYSGTFNYFQNNNPALPVASLSKNLPEKISLHQNYPNPFNPQTTIQFELPGRCEVTLKIFNILGEEICTLVSGHLPAGSYRYDWKAAEQASGVYFYHFAAKGSGVGGGTTFSETRKMVLLR